MNKKQAEQLLDKIVDGRNEIKRICEAERKFFEESELTTAPISQTEIDKIHIIFGRDLSEICKALQIEPSKSLRNCDNYPYQFDIFYNGFKIFALSESEELK